MSPGLGCFCDVLWPTPWVTVVYFWPVAAPFALVEAQTAGIGWPWPCARGRLASGLLLLGGVFAEQQVQPLGVWPARVSFSTSDGRRL